MRVSRTRAAGARAVLDDTRPLLARLDPFLRTLSPIVDYLGLYRREIAGVLRQRRRRPPRRPTPTSPAPRSLHYLRTTNPLNPEILAAYPAPARTNRSNPYTEPGGYDKLGRGPARRVRQLPVHANPGPSPARRRRPLLPADLRELIEQFVYGGPRTRRRAPPCGEQAPLGALVGQSGRYPRAAAAAAPAP